MNYIDPIIESLRDERIKQGKSMRAVSREMGVSNSSVTDWEGGFKSPTLRSLRLWTKTLGMTLESQERRTPV